MPVGDGDAGPMISFVVNSIDPAKFARVGSAITRAMGGGRFEIVGIHDAKSMCDGYRRGLAASRGDPVVFCHDDIDLLMTDLPARLARHFERFDLIAPVGTRKLVGMNWASAAGDNLYGAMTGGTAESGPVTVGYFGGATRQIDGIVAFEGVFIAARRHVAEAIGWDAETFDDWHGYDTDFSFRAHLAGYRLGVVLDLAIVHGSAGRFDAGYHRSAERFARKHAGRLASGQGPYILVVIPVTSADQARAFYDGGDLVARHRESRLRISRATNAAGHRAPAMLMPGAWDPARADPGAVVAADPPTRNGPCTCGSGLRYKDCHGKAVRAAR